MKITIIQVGKTKATYLQEAEKEYLKRLLPYSKVQIVTLQEEVIPKGDIEAGRTFVKQKEAKKILEKLPTDSFLITLDERGEQFTSAEFADFLKAKRDFEGGNLTFIIGGCYGLAAEVLQKAHLKLSFSSFTFTHELIRTLLLEQLYRAFSILASKTYHY